MFTSFLSPLAQIIEIESSRSIQNRLKLSKLATFNNAHKGTFSPDSKLLALIGRDYVDVIEIASKRRLIRVAPDNVTMLGARFSPDGRVLAIAYKIVENSQTNRFKVTLWDVSSGKEKLTLPVADDEWYRVIDDLSFSKDGELLASNLGGIARLWKTSDGRESRRFLPPDDKPDLQTQRVLLSPDGDWLAVYFERDKPVADAIRIWNLSTQNKFDLPTNVYRGWGFSADSKLLAVTAIERKGHPDEHSAVEIWDLNSGQRTKTIEVPKDWRGGFVVAFSPDASMIAIGGYKKFGVFGSQTGVLLAEARHTRSRFFEDNEMVNELSDIEFSADGKLLLTGGSDGSIKIWRVGR